MPVVTGASGTGTEWKSDRVGIPTGTSDPASGVVGDCYYHTGDKNMKIFDGTDWVVVSGGPAVWSNDGTTWSSLYTCATSSFDIPTTKAFDGVHGTAQNGDAARTSANAPMCVFDLTGNPQTVNTSIYVQTCSGYSQWIEITVDGTTYNHTPGDGVYTWNISGSLTKIRIQNDNPNGRTYLEGIKLDDNWMIDNSTT